MKASKRKTRKVRKFRAFVATLKAVDCSGGSASSVGWIDIYR